MNGSGSSGHATNNSWTSGTEKAEKAPFLETKVDVSMLKLDAYLHSTTGVSHQLVQAVLERSGARVAAAVKQATRSMLCFPANVPQRTAVLKGCHHKLDALPRVHDNLRGEVLVEIHCPRAVSGSTAVSKCTLVMDWIEDILSHGIPYIAEVTSHNLRPRNGSATCSHSSCFNKSTVSWKSRCRSVAEKSHAYSGSTCSGQRSSVASPGAMRPRSSMALKETLWPYSCKLSGTDRMASESCCEVQKPSPSPTQLNHRLSFPQVHGCWFGPSRLDTTQGSVHNTTVNT